MEWLFDVIGEWLQKSFLGSLLESFEPAAVAFLALGLVGGVLLLLSFLLDGLFDAFDFGGDGPLSLTTISAFTAVFGFTALATMAMGGNANVASLVGALVGIAGATGSFWLSRTIKGFESSATEEHKLEGSQGVVTIPIPEGGLGEIAVRYAGERHHMSAKSKEAIGFGEQVLISSVISSTSVYVTKIEEEQTSE